MHLSTHNWMRAEPLETTLARIKKFGYQSIEISGEPTQYNVNDTRRLLKQYGIRCWGSVTLTLAERNLAAKDTGQRARTEHQMPDAPTKYIASQVTASHSAVQKNAVGPAMAAKLSAGTA